ncbi:cyclic peptide export ABC transporter [Priestia filamentosa]|uniref:cyclic peptide export ABC transporter n=1 Tax=Priestia filamentosa TaxID=1402861 RepID=UPI0039821139
MKLKVFIIFLVFLFHTLSIVPYQIVKAADNYAIHEKRLDSFIEEQMDEGRIPGLSVVIVHGKNVIYQKGFGYANVETKKPVTKNTLFEIGSNSKAFTSLAIHQLADQGKIKLDDPVKKYLPWFDMKYEGEYKGEKVDREVDITINQLLFHTSGIPFSTVKDIPESTKDTALETTVKNLRNQKLNTYPGESFEYASMNYNILGLVIQEVTGQSFETYMNNNILGTLGLDNTFLVENTVHEKEMAQGYKIGFLKPLKFDAPTYRGNTPAGYFTSNGVDMAKWLKLQLGTLDTAPNIEQSIKETHIPNRSIPPSSDGTSYAGGWEVAQKGSGEFSHTGSNPNFSSFAVFRPGEELGVAVMANINSDIVQNIGQGSLDILLEKEAVMETKDIYKTVDAFSFTLLLFLIPFIVSTCYFLFTLIMQWIRKERVLEESRMKRLGVPSATLVFLLLEIYAIMAFPSVFFNGVDWGFIDVWAPITMKFATIAIFIGSVLFCLYLSLTIMFPSKKNNKNFFSLLILSVISGFGNAVIIFIINESLNQTDHSRTKLAIYFGLGIFVYVLTQKIVRTHLITLTNHFIYQKRTELLDKILNTPYETVEKMETEKIQSTLNNDTESISNHAPSIITGITDSITLVCCLVYLGVINIYGLLLSIGVILVAATFYYFAGQSANKLWEQTRNIQNIFFKFINDLTGGFKELNIDKNKRIAFRNDMEGTCHQYNIKRTKGGLKFANVFIIGELLFVVVIGAITFLFPLLFGNVQSELLRSYVFVFLYMTGPIHSILNAIPNAIQMKINWKRINNFSKQLDNPESRVSRSIDKFQSASNVKLNVDSVEYTYESSDGDSFEVGPITCEFTSGQITFITGGNGSGKSTLAKLISGLYSPTRGKIKVNNQEVDTEELSELYAAIFSDYYLFQKIYGIDCSKEESTIREYLNILNIEEKVDVRGGKLSTTKLSTGQRKRIALLISYLEDKEIYLFDEWAADQDPGFRHFFYTNLLPELKKKGKCIIAITHDDRYFNVADQLIKMERGQIMLEKESRSKSKFSY